MAAARVIFNSYTLQILTTILYNKHLRVAMNCIMTKSSEDSNSTALGGIEYFSSAILWDERYFNLKDREEDIFGLYQGYGEHKSSSFFYQPCTNLHQARRENQRRKTWTSKLRNLMKVSNR